MTASGTPVKHLTVLSFRLRRRWLTKLPRKTFQVIFDNWRFYPWAKDKKPPCAADWKEAAKNKRPLLSLILHTFHWWENSGWPHHKYVDAPTHLSISIPPFFPPLRYFFSWTHWPWTHSPRWKYGDLAPTDLIAKGFIFLSHNKFAELWRRREKKEKNSDLDQSDKQVTAAGIANWRRCWGLACGQASRQMAFKNSCWDYFAVPKKRQRWGCVRRILSSVT